LARAAITHYNAGRITDTDRVLRTLDAVLDTTALTYEATRAAATALPYPSRIISPLAVKLTDALVQAGRHLATSDPTAYEPDLADSLSSLGARLGEMGQWGEALTAEQEAVKIHQRLARENPAAYEPDLTRSLSNLGIQLGEVGRRGEAVTAEQEAVDLPLTPKSIESTRHKLKRLVSLGVLAEPEPGLFAQRRP
jgi:hypothetical protein